MTADVSSLVRLLSRYDRDDGGGGGGVEDSPKADLVTRDLLGGCCVVGGGLVPAPPAPKKAPFPDLQVPHGGEKGLQTVDLNLPPFLSSASMPPARTAALEASPPALDLRLRSLAAPPPAEYQSVCTLEKVKSALERAERESLRRRQKDPPAQPRPARAGSASPTSSSTTTSSSKRRLGGACGAEEGEGESGSPTERKPGVAKGEGGGGSGSGSGANTTTEMAAAGCPSCLLYVLISRSNPRCPRCGSAVPLPPALPPAAGKKPRIDLNAASAAAVAATSPIRTVKFF